MFSLFPGANKNYLLESDKEDLTDALGCNLVYKSEAEKLNPEHSEGL